MKKLNLFVFVSFVLPWSLSAGESFPKVAENFELHNVIAGKKFHSFAWDEHGSLWTLAAKGSLFLVERYGSPVLKHSFKRRGNHPSNILVNGATVFVSDHDVIRVFQQNRNAFVEKPSLVPPRDLFPATSRISSLRWSPLGDIHFAFHDEPGIGRVDPHKNEWDILAMGIAGGHFAFDEEGLMIASDISSDHLFRIATGLDYANGLENYTKADLALRLNKTGFKPVALAIYTGNQWPEENKATWLLYDRQSSTLQQFREEDNELKYWRTLAEWKRPILLSELQIGHDGQLWFIAGDAISRLGNGQSSKSAAAPDLASLNTPDLVAHLGHANSWHRDTALRALESREDLRAARGLHPSTDLHKLFQENAHAPLTRLHALWALHRTGLLDESHLENATDDPSILLKAWSARLFGERKYPTGPAFKRLEKMAQHTNSVVRTAVAIAARQFVSGSFTRITPPPIMPIREVFTGGILSTLWFSTENGSSPEFDLLYWNAVKPITAFDASHALGFFQGDREEGMAIAYWIITRICRQVAHSDDPLKQEDAILMLNQLKPANHRMLACALEGLKSGSPQRKVNPTEKSFATLRQFGQNPNQTVANLADTISELWSQPLPRIATSHIPSLVPPRSKKR